MKENLLKIRMPMLITNIIIFFTTWLGCVLQFVRGMQLNKWHFFQEGLCWIIEDIIKI